MVDIDYFKKFNDTYGHLEGDKALKVVASAIRKIFKRDTDLLARFGGEEFIIAISFEGLSHLTKRISKLQKLIESKHIENRNSDVSKDITVSIGSASVLPNPHLRYTDIIKKSDEMLYQAKDEGRNRFVHREI